VTFPGGPGKIGDAYIAVHADTLPFDRELDRNLERAAKDAETSLDRTGTQFGDKIGDSTSKRLGTKGKEFGRSIENATRNTVIQVRSRFSFSRIRDSIRRRFRRDVGDSLTDEVADAFDRVGRSGVFNRLTQGVADAIGAGFNVSGRSPLIAILIPAILALVGVVGAALQAINALVAVLFILPALLGSIALQIGVVAIAFQGLGSAIQGAFAAKNAKELEEALKGLTPSARAFVKELLPLKGFFKTLRDTVQENFFAQLTGAITSLRTALGPSLISGFAKLATAAGGFLRQFAGVLASPTFVKFIQQLFAATNEWVTTFGRALFGPRGFLPALTEMSITLIPFLRKFGDITVRFFEVLSGLMFRFASFKGTPEWLDRMAATLQTVVDLAFNLGDFLFVFLKGLDEAGGQNLITTLSEALQELIFFLTSPVGQKAMEGLVDLGIIGIKSFTGLLIAFLAVVAAFEAFAEFIKNSFVPGFLEALEAIGLGVVIAGVAIAAFFKNIGDAVRGFFRFIANVIILIGLGIKNFIDAVRARINLIIETVKGLPGRVLATVKNWGSILLNAGRSLIQGLIDGVRQKIAELFNLISSIAGRIGGFFGASPAKEGPLSGHGYTTFRGRRLMEGLIEGIRSEIPQLREVSMNAASNIVFGAGAVQVHVTGEAPDVNRARSAGSAVGAAAANVIAARNTRLAVRTL
jgi:hypothetical protein